MMGIVVVARLSGNGRWRRYDDDDVRLVFRELCGQCIERFSPSISILDLEILSFQIAEITQRPKQRISQICDGRGRKVTEAIDFSSLAVPAQRAAIRQKRLE